MVKSENRYNIPLAKKLNPNKGPNKIPPEIVILSANIIDSHLANIINHDLNNNSFSEGAKIATVHPIYKKSEN